MTSGMEIDSRTTILKVLAQELPYLRKAYGVISLALYGSYAHGNAGIDSDVDLIVTLSKPIGLAYIQLAEYLEEKLGRKVDLITASTLERGATDTRRAHITREIQESLIYV